MPATALRVLALGGEVQHAPIGRYETDDYLQRVVIATCSVAVTLALLVSLIPSNPPPLPDTRRLRSPQRDVEILSYNLSPPSILSGTIESVAIRTHELPTPIPVPDSELMKEPEFGTSDVGASRVDLDGVPGGTQGDALGDGDWLPSRPVTPEVFLFVEVPPELVSLTNPEYPELAREAGVEGTVHVKVLISEEGMVMDAVVLDGVPLLDAAAVEAARSAIFRPAQQSGQPVCTWVVIPIEFKLR